MEFKIEVEYNNHMLGVEGVREPLIPAVPPSLNDPGSPAEGGAWEVTDVYVLQFDGRGSRSRRLSRRAVDALADDDGFMNAVGGMIDWL